MEKPTIHAFLVADNVYKDISTGKSIVAGTFNTVRVESFPGRYDHPMSVFIALTNVRNVLDLALRFVDLKDGAILLEGQISITSSEHDPLALGEMAIPMPSLPLPHPGVFALELHWNEETIGSLRLYAQKS